MRNEIVRGASYERPRAFFCPLAQQSRLACIDTRNQRNCTDTRRSAPTEQQLPIL